MSRIIRGEIGNYRAPEGFKEDDYVLHKQLGSLYNDIRQLKSLLDGTKADLESNTNVDFYTRILVISFSIMMTIFGVLIKIKTSVNKIKEKDEKKLTEIQLRTVPNGPPPQYAGTICPY